MVNIITESRELSEVEEYLMTVAPSITPMKDVPDNTKIEVSAYLIFEDVKETTGETVEIMSILTPENKVYSCQSKTFKRSVLDIAGIMKDKPFSVLKISGKTKAGRDYINAVLDVTSL